MAKVQRKTNKDSLEKARLLRILKRVILDYTKLIGAIRTRIKSTRNPLAEVS